MENYVSLKSKYKRLRSSKRALKNQGRMTEMEYDMYISLDKEIALVERALEVYRV